MATTGAERDALERTSSRVQMIREIEDAACSNTGVTPDESDAWGTIDWSRISSENVSTIHSMIDGEALRLGLLEAMGVVIERTDKPVPDLTTFIRDIANHANFIWSEIEDKPYIDDDSIVYLTADLPMYRNLLDAGDELSRDEEARLILMGAFVPKYHSRERYQRDVLRFARARTLADVHAALQLKSDKIVDRIAEVEHLIDGSASSLTEGSL